MINISLNSPDDDRKVPEKFQRIFEIFNLNENLQFNILYDRTLRADFCQKLENIDQDFKSNDMINFAEIIKRFNLKNYDANLKYGHGKAIIFRFSAN